MRMRKVGPIGRGALSVTALMLLSSSATAAVLTFESNAGGFIQLNYSPMNPNYGNRVSAIPDLVNGFGYGTAGGLTPNVTASYNNASTYATWGVSTHVMTMQNPPSVANDYTVSLTLTADPGYLVNLNGFDAAYYNGGAFSVPMKVVDGANNVLWSANPLTDSGLSHQNFGGTPLQASTITLQLLNPSAGFALNFGVDNIEFSQTAVPEPASAALVGVLGLSLLSRRSKIVIAK